MAASVRSARAGSRGAPPEAPRLITIPISHFCEKARWALDRAEIAFVEEPHIQVVHVLRARRAGGGRTVPVLVTADGAITDSSSILEWVDVAGSGPALYPPGEAGAEARRIETWLDEGLGPDGRLWMYDSTLPILRQMRPWALAGVPRWERGFFRALGWALDPAIRHYLGVDPAAARAALVAVDGVFDEIGAMLADGRPFLSGDAFTAADLTFGALSASVLVPEAYGSPLPPLGALPPAMAAEVRRLREHPAGRFAARLYAEERHPAARPT
jgi:glutathione S-transferase